VIDVEGIEDAAIAMAGIDRQSRAAVLTEIGGALERSREELVALAMRETHLSDERLEGELTRMVGQFELYAAVVDAGDVFEPLIDHAGVTGGLTHADIRQTRRPVGPVAVYAAGNFPFAFGAAGTDTASALAAGCPVVVKGHPGHPQLSRAIARILGFALESRGMHPQTFVHLEGFDEGLELIAHPAIAAAAFTGSLRAGRALYDLANARPDPIPFFGELGGLNPVFVFASALERDLDGLASGLATVLTSSAGQLCTKPGLIFVPRESPFTERVGALVSGATVPDPLSPEIRGRFDDSLELIRGVDGVRLVSRDDAEGVVLAASMDAFLLESGGRFLTECFGPGAVLIEYESPGELVRAAEVLHGALTATIRSADPSEPNIRYLLDVLERRAGRIVYNDWPTGVGVTWAMHHGGPYPATTAPGSTSVGPAAILRFLRPIAYQGLPHELLPDDLRDTPADRGWRRVDGRLELALQKGPG
jgi:NADP-dependent aldehyde dehydrogenase